MNGPLPPELRECYDEIIFFCFYFFFFNYSYVPGIPVINYKKENSGRYYKYTTSSSLSSVTAGGTYDWDSESYGSNKRKWAINVVVASGGKGTCI